LPPINVDRPRRLHEFPSSEGDDPNSDPEVLAQKTEELRQYFSLPKIFKATVDTETYKRLCDLGFRRPFYDAFLEELCMVMSVLVEVSSGIVISIFVIIFIEKRIPIC
jgi:hypothetical protein